MVDDIRRNLDKVTGELLESFVSFDRKSVLHFQTGLHIIHKAEQHLDYNKKTNLYAICDNEKLEKLLSQYGVEKEEFDKVPDIIGDLEVGKPHLSELAKSISEPLRQAIKLVSEKNRAVYDIPASGMIALMLNLVNSDVKDALVVSRAGERTLQTVERSLRQKKFSQSLKKEDVLKDRLYDYGSSKRLARPYIGEIDHEPKDIVSAKAMQHLADLLEMVVLISPETSENKYVQSSFDALKALAAKTLYSSSYKLHKLGQADAGEKIGKLANHLVPNNDFSNMRTIDDLKNDLVNIEPLLESTDYLDGPELNDFIALLNQRVFQISEHS